MGIHRKLESETTTMQVFWNDKDELSRFRLLSNRYKNQNGKHYESDKDLMKRMTMIILKLSDAKKIEKFADRLSEFEKILEKLNKPNDDPLSTLPWKTQKEDKLPKAK